MELILQIFSLQRRDLKPLSPGVSFSKAHNKLFIGLTSVGRCECYMRDLYDEKLVRDFGVKQITSQLSILLLENRKRTKVLVAL
jgi:hypothetical protein